MNAKTTPTPKTSHQQVFKDKEGRRQGYVEQNEPGKWLAESGTGESSNNVMAHAPEAFGDEASAKKWVGMDLAARDAIDDGDRRNAEWVDAPGETCHF